jgi:hypothetical protein
MNDRYDREISEEDCFNLGKADAWAGKPKLSPSDSPVAASMYDLGYNEGEIKHPPIVDRIAFTEKKE